VRGRPRGPVVNALRLAFGTLTVLRVKAPVVDRRTAGRAMVLAPVVGLVLAVLTSVLVGLAQWAELSPLVAAVLVVGLLAVLTRAMHLDGLADTADGLGSGRPAAEALEVMRRGDVGPFGVVTLVLVLALQVAAVTQLLVSGLGLVGLSAALVVSRLILPLACLAGIPAARRDGLGATVAGSVTRSGAAGAVLLALAVPALLVGLAGRLTYALDTATVLIATAIAALGLLAAAVLCRHAVRRLGGVTGDVLGACVETTFTASLLLLCLLP
jgi:adenosylcobinamide-GDP ribazoletransferase